MSFSGRKNWSPDLVVLRFSETIFLSERNTKDPYVSLVAVVLREIFPLEMTSSFHCGFLLLILCLHPELRGHDPQPQASFTPSSLGLSPFLNS